MALTRHAREIPNSPDMGFDPRREAPCDGIINCTICHTDVWMFQRTGKIPNPNLTVSYPIYVNVEDVG